MFLKTSENRQLLLKTGKISPSYDFSYFWLNFPDEVHLVSDPFPVRRYSQSSIICSKLTIKTPGVVLVSLLCHTPCSSVSIVNFEQVNTGWVECRLLLAARIRIRSKSTMRTTRMCKNCPKLSSFVTLDMFLSTECWRSLLGGWVGPIYICRKLVTADLVTFTKEILMENFIF